LKTPFYIDHLPNRILNYDDKPYLWFSGTSYLGISQHPSFREKLSEGLQIYGTSWGSSRNNTLRLCIYEEAEQCLASFVEAPAALTTSSGMMAGQLIVQHFASQHYALFIAPRTHPALWTLHHQPNIDTWTNWAAQTAEIIMGQSIVNAVLCCDAIGSPFVEAFQFDYLASLLANVPLTLVVDESHSLGVCGHEGKGLYTHLVQLFPKANVVVVSSLNKALGVQGGVIFTQKELISSIQQNPFFAGASPIMPAMLYACMYSIDLYKHLHSQMLGNVRYFKQLIGDNALFTSVTDYPAFCTRQQGIHEYLKEQHILTASFPYPTPQDPATTRLMISAIHKQEDLDILANVCLSYTERHYVCKGT
jgi:8-amino-7-oxononanoate synthase